jgi:vWA-MoxR associated protein C-terminal domain/Trypsin-like peptidase domain
MGESEEIRPGADAWVVAIYAAEDDFEPSGSGVVLDELRILTCYHVVKDLTEQWVAFPKADGDGSLTRRRAERVIYPENCGEIRDLAILVLAEPVPDGVAAAPLRFPEPTRLVGRPWWAFGFPADPLGSSASGSIGDTRGYGWVMLHRGSADPVEYGFSGGGLWCSDYQGVVGIVGHAKGDSGGGRAITLYAASQWFPGQNLSDLANRYVEPIADDAAQIAPEIAELAGRLDEVPGAMAIIREVFDRTPAVAHSRATILQLLTRLQELVPQRGEKPLLQQVSDLAAERRMEMAAPAALVTPAGADTPADDACLLVVIRQDLYEPKEFTLSLTLFRDGQPGEPQECGTGSGSLEQIKGLLRERVPEILFSARTLPMIEFAVPEDLLGKNFDQWPVPSRPHGPLAEDYRLGERYPVVVRDLDRTETDKIPAADRDMWESRWNRLLADGSAVPDLLREVDLQEIAELRPDVIYKSLRAAFRLEGARGNAVLALLPAGKSARITRIAVPRVLKAGCDAGMPAVIWLRHPEARRVGATPVTADDDDDRRYLAEALGQADPAQPALRDLPRRVQSLRLQAEADQRHASHPGRRLSLLWADPNRSWIPPELQLPPRSSNGADQ